jgi:hypothetical protein
MNRTTLSASFCVTLLAFAGPGLARDKCGECGSIEDWATFTSISLTLSHSGQPPIATWKGRFDHKANDIVIDADVTADPGRMKGSIAMVGGRVMLTKGMKLERAYEIDALDGPVLSMQLVLRLLDRVFPKGPSSIPQERRIDRKDPIAIKYATPSASGRIPAPWHLSGKVAKTTLGAVTYDLVLEYPGEGRGGKTGSEKMHMVGELGVLAEPVFRDDSSVEGWTPYGVGPQEEKSGDSTILDYGAKRHEVVFRTVGDVRGYIADEFGPGKRDATKDFTGSWKGKCAEDFGLKILHRGDEAKYAVLFCGPGGCDDVETATLTYITGDKGYTVVNDDEILSGRGAGKQRYVRCSKEVGSIATPR